MTTDALAAAREHADHAWNMYALVRWMKQAPLDWQIGASVDGSPYLTAEIPVGTGDDLVRLASDALMPLDGPADQSPMLDFSVPGRTACVWRAGGVWVELRHNDRQQVGSAASPLLTARPDSGRSHPAPQLPFIRDRSKESA